MPIIPLNVAREMIQRYQTNRASMLNSRFSTDVLVLSEQFPKSDMDSLINQTGCTGVRVYVGMDTDLNMRVILVGTDNNNEDIIDATLPVIIEEGQRCPPFCPTTGLGA